MELDMVGYVRLGALRKDFDQWLKDEGLTDELVTRMRFGEGVVDAYCVVKPPHTDEGEVVREWRTYPVTKPPPVLVLQAIRYAQRDGSLPGEVPSFDAEVGEDRHNHPGQILGCDRAERPQVSTLDAPEAQPLGDVNEQFRVDGHDPMMPYDQTAHIDGAES